MIFLVVLKTKRRSVVEVPSFSILLFSLIVGLEEMARPEASLLSDRLTGKVRYLGRRSFPIFIH